MTGAGATGTEFGRAAGDYKQHRRGFPASFFARLAELGLGGPGARALDLGTGTGSVAHGLAAAGARVAGLDLDLDMLRAARDTAGGPSFVRARAETLPFESAAFELVVAGQCWHWFDGPAAAAECARVLVKAGTLVVAHFDYLALPGNVAGLTEELILARNPTWPMAGSDGLYDRWRPHLAGAGFGRIERFTYDEPAAYTQAAWRGRIRACNGVLALRDPERIAELDRALAAKLSEVYGDDVLDVPHRVFALVAAR